MQFLEAAIADGADECLFWPFARNSAGYGHFWLAGRDTLANRYVCEKAWGPPPTDKPLALHSCGNGELGCIAPRHLRWGDKPGNAIDAIAEGHWPMGVRAAFAKLTPEIVRAIRAAVGTQQEIAAHFGVTQSNVSQILRRKTWAHVA